jgi:hypothetical protein
MSTGTAPPKIFFSCAEEDIEVEQDFHRCL